jgi:hypothetical protein
MGEGKSARIWVIWNSVVSSFERCLIAERHSATNSPRPMPSVPENFASETWKTPPFFPRTCKFAANEFAANLAVITRSSASVFSGATLSPVAHSSKTLAI